MSFFQWIFKRKEDNQMITEEMRNKGLEIRRLNHNILQLEKQLEMKQRLEILQEAVTGETKGNKEEQLILNLLMGFMQKPQQQQFSQQPNTLTETNEITLNREQITQTAQYLKNNFPKPLINQLSSLTDKDLSNVRKELIK